MSEIAIPVAVGVLSGVIGTFVTLKLVTYQAKNVLDDIIDERKTELLSEIEQFLNSEKGQKALYTIGGLVGAGAKSQMFSGKGRGGLKDLLPELIGGFLQGRAPQMGQQPQTPQSQGL